MPNDPSTKLYYLLAGTNEEADVRSSGALWGKAMRVIAGNGPPCVKAFVGSLPPGRAGYTFTTNVEPTRSRMFIGGEGAVWFEGAEGVEPVDGHPDFVKIKVTVIDGE